MRIVGVNHIQAYLGSASPEQGRDVRAWRGLVLAARWAGPADVMAAFPNATSASPEWTFPLAASGVVIEATIEFRTGTVLVKKVK